ECPNAHFRVTFEAVPVSQCGLNSGQGRQRHSLNRVPSWVDKTMLVRDIGSVQNFDQTWWASAAANQCIPAPDRPISGVKWLEFTNPLAFARSKKLDPVRARDLFPFARIIEDREFRNAYLLFGESASLAEDCELDDEMIERC